MNTEKNKPSSISDFLAKKREEEGGHPVSLPSGLVAFLKKPKVNLLMIKGVLTDEMLDLAIRSEKSTSKELAEEILPTQINTFMDMCKRLAVELCITPKLTLEATDEEKELLSVNDLTEEDIMFFLSYVMYGDMPTPETIKKKSKKEKTLKNSSKTKKAT